MNLKERCENNGFKYNLVQDSCYQYCFVSKYGIQILTDPWSFGKEKWNKQKWIHEQKEITMDTLVRADMFEAELNEIQEGYSYE